MFSGQLSFSSRRELICEHVNPLVILTFNLLPAEVCVIVPVPHKSRLFILYKFRRFMPRKKRFHFTRCAATATTTRTTINTDATHSLSQPAQRPDNWLESPSESKLYGSLSWAQPVSQSVNELQICRPIECAARLR